MLIQSWAKYLGQPQFAVLRSSLIVLKKHSFWEKHWALVYKSKKFWNLLISKTWVVQQFIIQLVYTTFFTDNCASFLLRRKENYVKHQKVSKYYNHHCLKKFILLFISLLAAPVLKKSHIFSGILKNALCPSYHQHILIYNHIFKRNMILIFVYIRLIWILLPIIFKS